MVDVVDHAQRHVTVVAIEQPFAPGNVVEHARLAAAIEVPVSLDEGVRHRRDLDQIVRYRAARLVCIKPARVGGFAQARTMIERAQLLGLDAYVGGFFESPLARGANAALARHYVSLPSDIGDTILDSVGLFVGDDFGLWLPPGDNSGVESTPFDPNLVRGVLHSGEWDPVHKSDTLRTFNGV